MIRYACDRCGCRLEPNDPRRYIVRMEIYAAVGNIEIDTKKGGDEGERVSDVLAQLSRANPDEVEDQTYRRFRFDLCAGCHRRFLDNPLAE